MCGGCGVIFPRSKSEVVKENYCTPECWMKARNVDRVCKQCGQVFTVWRTIVLGSTNASGNFCSRRCYDAWLVAGATEKTHRLQIKGPRRDAVVAGKVCLRCGAAEPLDIHHIVPSRIGGTDEPSNLIPLCKGCHKIVEVFTCDLITKGTPPEAIAQHVRGLLEAERSTKSAAV